MAQVTVRTRKKIEPVEADEISLSELEQQTETIVDDDLPDDMAFESIVNDLGLSDESGKVNVYKLRNGNYGEQIFLFECMPIEFSLTMLQNPEYHTDGFHNFKVILRNSRNIVKAKQISVMPNAKLFEKLEPVIHNNSNDFIMAIKAINDSNQALMATLINNQKQEVIQPQKTTIEFLQEMQMMKEIFNSNQAPQTLQQSPLEVLELAKELALAMNPDANTGIMSTMGKMLEKYGEPIMNAIANAPAQVTKTPIVIPIPDSPHGITPNPLPNLQLTPVTAESDDMSIMLKVYLNQLLSQAKRNADVELYADLVLDQVGDDIFPMLEAPNWFERLVALNPAISEHKAWFDKLRQAILYDPTNDDVDEIDLTNDNDSTINELTKNSSNIVNEPDNADDTNP